MKKLILFAALFTVVTTSKAQFYAEFNYGVGRFGFAATVMADNLKITSGRTFSIQSKEKTNIGFLTVGRNFKTIPNSLDNYWYITPSIGFHLSDYADLNPLLEQTYKNNDGHRVSSFGSLYTLEAGRRLFKGLAFGRLLANKQQTILLIGISFTL